MNGSNGSGRDDTVPPRGVPGKHNGSGAPGHVDAKPVPPRSGSGNAWNSHGKGSSNGNGGGRDDAVPPRGVPGQHNGSGAPGHVDAKPVPPRSGSGNAWNSHGNGNGNANGRGNGGGRGDTTPPRGTPGQHNGSGTPGHVGKPVPPRSGSGNGGGKDNAPNNDRGDHFNNWNGRNYSSGNGQKYDSHFYRPGNVYRPPRVVPTLPVGYRHYSWNGGAYYQHAGLWYRPYGTRYVVVGAPYGLSVSWLPSYYSSFWFGGVHYFHADSTYYLYEPAHRTYVVTHSPYESEGEVQESSGGTDEDLYIYPAQGQSEQQQADDRYECHRWAVDQAGYDPIESDYDADQRAEYLRAMTACLTGRGYSVR